MSNPFEAYRLALVRGRTEHIGRILQALGRSKFEHITALAETVAVRLTEAEQRGYELAAAEYELAKERDRRDESGRLLDERGRLLKEPKRRKPVSKVTLLRNDKYAGLLVGHLTKIGMVRKNSHGPKAKSMDAFSAQLEIRNKQNEIDRLNKYIEKLQKANEVSQRGALPKQDDDAGSAEMDELRAQVGLLARAIQQILKYPALSQFFVVDPARRFIDVPNTLRRAGPLVGKKESEAYFDAISDGDL